MDTPLVPATDLTGTVSDVEPANRIWVELTTRITTQPLHYRSGDEDTACQSVRDLFGIVREQLGKHPQATAFAEIAVPLLNDVIRPYTARWHRWIVDKRFRDEWARRTFRRELQILQVPLRDFGHAFHLLAGRQSIPAAMRERLAGYAAQRPGRARLGNAFAAGIRAQVPFAQGATPEEINRAEHTRLLERRELLESTQEGDGLPGNGAEPKVMSAAGLAFSGGGIRSATLCLGILQVLSRRGMVHQFDYLSTVSGGGYLGAFVSSYLGTTRETVANASRGPCDPKEPILPASREDIENRWRNTLEPKNGTESEAVRHLRNNSKYLMNGGVWARFMALGLLVGGVLMNLLLILPMPLLAAALYAELVQLGFWLNDGSLLSSLAGRFFLIAGGIFALVSTLLPTFEARGHGQPPFSPGARRRGIAEILTLTLGLVAVGAGVLAVVPFIFNLWHEIPKLVPTGLDIPGGDALLVALSALLPLLLAPAGAAAQKAAPSWISRVLKRLLPLLYIASGPLFYLIVWLYVGDRLVHEHGTQWSTKWVFGVALFLMVWGWWLVDINTLSPHRYYRNRLCECYLAIRGMDQAGWLWRTLRNSARRGGEDRHGLLPDPKRDQLGTVQHLPLTCLGATGAAPYHLINGTVNLPASNEKNLRGRDGDFFLFSREFCGSPITGYVKTATMEALDPHVDLGTAMSISGAAAAANMGTKTVRQYRFLLALFNIRLGYWLPRPGVTKAVRPGAIYLLREMTATMDEHLPLACVSDGGHIENLGVYELIRRRCRFILSIDAGMEPGLECTDLLAVQRYAAIDLGVRIEFDLADLLPDKRGLSRAHAVLGKIHYTEPNTGAGGSRAETGWLLYLKLAVTGAEPGYVADYRRLHPAFPHESTGDQIYDEAQFEAYRALGETAMTGLFRAELLDVLPPDALQAAREDRLMLADWFQALATNLLPDNDPAFGPAPG